MNVGAMLERERGNVYKEKQHSNDARKSRMN